MVHRDGKDGPWSTFRIQVGNPPQQIRVLPASDQSSTWVVLPEACWFEDEEEADNCPGNRGQTFNRNDSSSWEEHGSYELNTFIPARVGLGGSAIYGYDTIELGWAGDNMPKLPYQVVANVFTEDFYLGSLALNPRPINFTDYNNPIPSLLETLRKNSSEPIPSTSWSYTAGSHNLAPKVFGSLILGGYDTTRFTPNNVTFPFGADISLDFQVAIQTVTTSLSEKPLLDTGIISYISTLIPEIWLPDATCKLFEEAFGLVYDNETTLYMLSDELHSSLLQKNPSVSFKVGPAVDGDSVTIDMPYWNFYQTATPDYLGNRSGLYFPLRRAANDTQYILGRTFLQSAYLSVDYDRETFNLSQALYPATSVKPNVVPIIAPFTGNKTAPSDSKSKSTSSKGLSTGAIAGIAVGAAIATATIAIIAFVVFRRKRAAKPKKVPELDDTDVMHNMAHEVDGEGRKYEVGDGLRHEVGGDEYHKVELYAGEDQQKPVEADGSHLAIYEMPAEEVKRPELEGESEIRRPELEGEGHLDRKTAPGADVAPDEKSALDDARNQSELGNKR